MFRLAYFPTPNWSARMPKRQRTPGEFCWINILTPDPDAARDFFSNLLGWEYGEIPSMGSLIKVDGSEVGGLFDLASPQTPPGTPPLIGVMVKVDSADATAERVKALGGSAKPAFDIMTNGRMAECTDPLGANFDLWQAMNSPGTDVDTTVHGAPSWFENLTGNMDRAAKFYTDLFGWKGEVMPMPDVKYMTFKHGDEWAGGMIEMGGMPPHWGVYFTVDDVDASTAKAIELGGKVFMPAKEAENVGRFCGLTSPQGVHFYVITYFT
jgi:predicted enzyme related to lactoylglutathione lyase